MPLFTVSKDLLDPKHVTRIGSAIWEFMVLIDMQTGRDGTVNHGKPVMYSEIARRLGRTIRTVERNMTRLKPYLESQKTRRGKILRIKKPKKAFRPATFVGSKELDPPLSLPQHRLLELLYINHGQVCTREQVVLAVWPDAESSGVSEQSIDALVRRLRDRLTEGDPEHAYVVTVRGHGFRLDNPPLDGETE